MAFLFTDPNQEEEEKRAAGESGGAPTTGGGGEPLLGSDAPAQAPGAGAAAATPAGSGTSSGWTNLRSYLDANQEQAGDLANKVAGNITQTGEAAKAGVEKGVADYNTQISSLTPGNGADLAARASSNPVEFLKDPNAVKSAKDFQAGVFKGPQKFEMTDPYGDATTQAQKGADLATQATREGGRRGLLKDLEPNLSEGGISLNDMLLAGVPGAKDKLTAAAQPYAGLRSWLDTETTKSDAARDKAAGDFGAEAGKFKTGFVDPQKASLESMKTNLNKRVEDASLDFNKDQSIQWLENYMAGNAPVDKTARAQFEPEGLNPDGYDMSAMGAKVRDLIMGKLNPALVTDQYIDQGRRYLLGDDSALAAPDALRQYLDPLRSGVWQYSNDPIEKLRGQGGASKPDWLSRYFGGTQKSSGTASPGSVAMPEEVARILALQELIDGSTSFLSPADSGIAGSYRPASIGRFKPQIGFNPGTPPPPGIVQQDRRIGIPAWLP